MKNLTFKKVAVWCLATALIFVAGAANSARSEVLCRKKSAKVVSGKVNLAAAFSSADETCASGSTAVTVAGKTLIAFGRTNNSGNLLSFGGSQVTSATVSSPQTGTRDFIFSGTFPALSAIDESNNREKLTVLCTARTGDFVVCNSYVYSAKNDEIAVEAYNWISNVESEVEGSDLQVAVFAANS